MNILHKKIFFLCVISFPLISKENKDVWTVIAAGADTATKNTLYSVCTELKNISHKNNPALYLCKNLTLTPQQQTYALELAAYYRWNNVLDHLLSNGAT